MSKTENTNTETEAAGNNQIQKLIFQLLIMMHLHV